MSDTQEKRKEKLVEFIAGAVAGAALQMLLEKWVGKYHSYVLVFIIVFAVIWYYTVMQEGGVLRSISDKIPEPLRRIFESILRHRRTISFVLLGLVVGFVCGFLYFRNDVYRNNQLSDLIVTSSPETVLLPSQTYGLGEQFPIITMSNLQHIEVIDSESADQPIVSASVSEDWVLLAGSRKLYLYDFIKRKLYDNVDLILPSRITKVESTLDGRYLAVAGDDGTVIVGSVYSKPDGVKISVLRVDRPGGRVNDLAFGGTGDSPKWLAIGVEDGTIVFWDIHNRQEDFEFAAHTSRVVSVAFNSDSCLLLTGNQEGIIKMWEIKGKDIREKLQLDNNAEITDLTFSPEGRRIVSAGQDGTIRMYDLQGKVICCQLREHAGPVLSLAIHPINESQLLLTGGQDYQILAWDVATGHLAQRLNRHTGGVSQILFAKQGQLIVSTGHDGSILIWGIPATPSLSTPIALLSPAPITLSSPAPTTLLPPTPTPLPPVEAVVEEARTNWWIIFCLGGLALLTLALFALSLFRTRNVRQIVQNTTGQLKRATMRLNPRTPAKARLVVMSGYAKGREYRIPNTDRVVIVGRDPDFCDFPLGDSQVSNPHFKITFETTDAYITDEGSTNGTKVNGVPLHPGQRMLLQRDAIIDAGGARVQFRLIGGTTRVLTGEP